MIHTTVVARYTPYNAWDRSPTGYKPLNAARSRREL